ncbi:MAG: AAA family ATPase [Peptococcaceae bacterium]|jgi:stage V sporulation protein K|nr:AAA family ATPase [Peptococcaceae bacterium]
MSINIKFRHNLPPLIHRPAPVPDSETNYLRNLPKVQNNKGRPLHRNQDQDKDENIKEILKELDEMIGLKMVKSLIHELRAFVEIQKKRQRENLATEPLVLHMVFKGNPGSGKTTIARLLGKLFKELGVLEKGHVVECERADLVGEYIGHTASKTKDMIRKSLGGVLFIDEAYSLARGGEKDFGKEAIDTLVKAMEDHKDNLILILAGYRLEMDRFIETNPGLRSRFPIQIHFPDYTIDELFEIGELMLSKREYEFTPESQAAFRRLLEKTVAEHPYSGNARMVRNIIEKAIRKQAVRLYRQTNPSREELIRIMETDLECDDLDYI